MTTENKMHIKEIFKKTSTSLSFEYFPPKTEKGADSLFEAISRLETLKPSFVSITYGAGGKSGKLTSELVIKIHRHSRIPVVAHLTCRDNTKDDLYNLLKYYCDNGITNIMALRGDPSQKNEKFIPIQEGFKYAYELVKFIKTNFPKMGIGVAGYPEGHPETPNRQKEMDYLKMKVDAGADYLCTQLFFNNDDFYDFRERCELANIKIPILAGIMPITSKKTFKRIPSLALGTKIPARLIKKFLRADTPEKFTNIGIQWATEQVNDLLDNNVDGIHFYTLNKSNATIKIYKSLGF